jgi:hypothetical protein
MDDNTTDLPLAPKKLYVRPQLHELSGADAAGKNPLFFELDGTYGPS